MSDLSKLAALMKADWDRRIGHDYRFWMSDGYSSDQAMWEAGARDFGILTKGLFPNSATTVLDIGCGVGRLLKSALISAGRVIGMDVSAQAIQKARSLLGNNPRLELYTGNGFDLQPVPNESVDLVISFATFGSIPEEICVAYLREVQRVLKPGGLARIQLYVGSVLPVQKDDTLNLRCYRREDLEATLKLAGFEIQFMEELVLPLQVSFKDLGFTAAVAGLRKTGQAPADSKLLLETLLPPAAPVLKGAELAGSDLEYWMSVNYASELAERGDLEKAQATLDYACTLAKNVTIDVSDILERLKTKLNRSAATKAGAPQQPAPSQAAAVCETGADVFERNLALLSRRFPEVASKLNQALTSGVAGGSVEVRQSAQGPVLYVNGQCLDHPQKPVAGAESWARKLVQEERFKNAGQAVLVGCGTGYHLEALVQLSPESGPRLCLLEPDLNVFVRALKLRDAARWLGAVQELRVGEDVELPVLQPDAEIWFRPQTQAVTAAVCERLRSGFYGQRGLGLLSPAIGVVGPLAGGTQPIMEYVTRALFMQGQRTRMFDMSGFNSGYLNLENFVKDKTRRKVTESTYCEMMSQVLLDAITEKPIDILFCMALAPISPRVLTELRKRGIITVLWFVEDFARFTYWRENARFYDFIFTIQKGKCIQALREAGAGEVHYVPVGCDPAVHAPVTLTAEERQRWGAPISFMGAGYHNRQQIFAALADLPLKIFGTEWPTCRPFDRLVQEGGRRLNPAEYVKIFSASDININLHSSHERDGVDPFGDFLNPRTFELASAGAFQLVDKRSLLSESFQEGKEVMTFSSAAELKQRIHYFLAHPEERMQAAKLARERALAEHTYQHRIRQMLSIIYSSKFEQLKARLDNGAWRRTLRRAKKHDELYERCQRAFKRGEEPNLDGLVSDVVTGQGKLTETEQKLLFLFHVTKQIIRMTREESGER